MRMADATQKKIFKKGATAMKRFTRIVLAVFLFAGSLIALCLSKMVAAGEAPPANPYAGDIWTRSTLTGDWGALRNRLAEKGVTSI
jgi:cytochrome c-type biogenesis protein CcmH/NrfG